MGLLLLLLQVFLWTAIVGGLAWVGACVWLHLRHPEPYWDWGNLAIDDVSFPGDFLWGVATAAHQVEGGSSDSNWTWWESQSDPSGMPRIAGGQAAGDACDHWNRYPEDIELMKQLGVTSYRFSIDWARVEPRPGEFDADAIAHYHGVLAALKEAGIRPCITLLHFSWPMWFEQLGAFEKSANIAHFERFARRMFQEYRPACKLWCTVNESEVVSLMGYLLGMFPPGQQDLHTALLVQRNLVLAHAKVYQALKHAGGRHRADRLRQEHLPVRALPPLEPRRVGARAPGGVGPQRRHHALHGHGDVHQPGALAGLDHRLRSRGARRR